MKYITPLFLVLLLAVGYGVSAHNAQAGLLDGLQNTASQLGIYAPPYQGGGADSNLAADLIIKIVNWLLSMVAVLALLALVYASILYIISLGDDDKVKKAKTIILYAIGGVLLSGASFLILRVVRSVLTK